MADPERPNEDHHGAEMDYFPRVGITTWALSAVPAVVGGFQFEVIVFGRVKKVTPALP
jgi:hypothetical protein